MKNCLIEATAVWDRFIKAGAAYNLLKWTDILFKFCIMYMVHATKMLVLTYKKIIRKKNQVPQTLSDVAQLEFENKIR